jgi:hypothetical protein
VFPSSFGKTLRAAEAKALFCRERRRGSAYRSDLPDRSGAADAGDARPAMIAAMIIPKVGVISKALMLSSCVLLRRRLEHEL